MKRVGLFSVMILMALAITASGQTDNTKEKTDTAKTSKQEKPRVAPRFMNEPKLDDLLTAYYKIGDLLSADKVIGVTEAAKAMAIAANTELRRAAEHLHTIGTKGDLKSTRKAYLAYSDVFIAYIGQHTNKPAALGLKVHCPMYAGDWLQRPGTKEVMNPYYGSGMLHCGTFENWSE